MNKHRRALHALGVALVLSPGAWMYFVIPVPGVAALAGTQQVSKPVQEYVARLESSYRDVKTMRAEFTQTYVAGGRSRVESGTVYFARGGRMRWDYREPEEKLFLSDGKKIMLYVPAEKQLTRSMVKSSDDARVPFRLMLSRLNLRRVFGRIEFADPATKPQAGNQILRALPKHEDEESFQEVLFELTPDFDIRKLVIRYPDHSAMEFTFNTISRNVQINPTLFQFNPPAGTEVIDSSKNQ
jgi:outer membrane lipoprotein carrier protein